MLQPQKWRVSQGGRDASINCISRGYVKTTNTFQGPATNTKEGKSRRISAPYPQVTSCREKHTAFFIQKFLFSVHHLAIHYQPKTNRAQETTLMNSVSRKYKDVEQDLKHKWFRHSCILQKVIYWAFILHLSNYIWIGAVILIQETITHLFPSKGEINTSSVKHFASEDLRVLPRHFAS